MPWRIIIAGCRDYTNYPEARELIERALENFDVCGEPVLLSGASRGADELGERFARERGWKIERYPAQWAKYKRAAGPIRNKRMAQNCDGAICFWDKKSRGTASLIRYAQEMGKPLEIFYITT